MADEVRYEQRGRIALITLNRPRYANAQNSAMVHGACIAGGLMLAWVCDLIVAAQDAFFADPVVKMGIPGVEYFAHPWVLGPRLAKRAVNQCEDLMGMRSGMDSVFGLHHVAHAHNAEVSGHSLAGLDARAMRDPM